MQRDDGLTKTHVSLPAQLIYHTKALPGYFGASPTLDAKHSIPLACAREAMGHVNTLALYGTTKQSLFIPHRIAGWNAVKNAVLGKIMKEKKTLDSTG